MMGKQSKCFSFPLMTELSPDFRALCKEIVDAFDIPSSFQYKVLVIARARAALATTPPKPPTDKELNALWIEQCGYTGHSPAMSISDFKPAARAVLERWGQR
jgi:hypothetical protein